MQFRFVYLADYSRKIRGTTTRNIHNCTEVIKRDLRFTWLTLDQFNCPQITFLIFGIIFPLKPLFYFTISAQFTGRFSTSICIIYHVRVFFHLRFLLLRRLLRFTDEIFLLRASTMCFVQRLWFEWGFSDFTGVVILIIENHSRLQLHSCIAWKS